MSQISRATRLIYSGIGLWLAFSLPVCAARVLSSLTGCPVRQGNNYLLTDESSHVTAQLRGGKIRAGNRVEVTGSLVPDATPVSPATEVIAVASVKDAGGSCSSFAGPTAGGSEFPPPPAPAPPPPPPPQRATRPTVRPPQNAAVAAPPSAQSIPSFQWPPPRASASADIPNPMLTGNRANLHLADVASELERAFNGAGYVERSYYAVPQGFALAARLEMINPDGSSVAEANRWSASIAAPKVFSLSSYLQALLGATPGEYRVVVFIVTAVPVTESAERPTQQQAQDWLSGGANKLPSSIGEIPYTSDSACTAKIYEFAQESRDSGSVLRIPSALTGQKHLEAAGLWKALQQ